MSITVNKTVGLYLLDKEKNRVNPLSGFPPLSSLGQAFRGNDREWGKGVPVKFVVDSMLGRLATWLRVLGYDTHYQSFYRDGEMTGLMLQDRYLVTRDRTRRQRSERVVFLDFDQVGEQLKGLFSRLELHSDPSLWFTRCLRCNVVLEDVAEEEATEKVPEYVFYQSRGKIKVCRSCDRYFWPGSHRNRMLKQLTDWGFAQGNDSYDLT